jgi:hypothetical protein
MVEANNADAISLLLKFPKIRCKKSMITQLLSTVHSRLCDWMDCFYFQA